MEKHQAFARALARKNQRSGHVTIPSSSTAIPTSFAPPPPLSASKTDDSKPIVISSAPKTKGRKRSAQEKTPSPTKRKRNSDALLTGPLDPNIHVSDRLEFNLTPEEREPFKKLTPSKASDMAYELLSRAGICLNYDVGTTKPLLVSELEISNKKLEKPQEDVALLTEGLEKANKKAEDDRAKAAASLLKSQNEVKRLQQSVDSLSLSLQQSSNQIKQLTSKKAATIADRDKSLVDFATLEDELCEERQRGFEQGIAQCHYFFKCPLQHEGFHIMKILVDGQLVDISPQPSTEVASAPDQAAPNDAPLVPDTTED
ncbi:uncharacterized protein LOC111242562 [Vigna radiata var. radiata]|uniref:Uncharacterized protein LOC111242562 n=1 Tax=Vigna radiata var. radiata TaxID=3916 RepID=A0A3Q0FIQ1_VIGRR|nr:uncharacterized protein LOC111242562 [Vigna radiata var. radiata]